MYLTNFIFANFLSYCFIPNFQNDAILINHEAFFQEKESSQIYRFQFLKINSSMAKTIKKQFFKTKLSIFA